MKLAGFANRRILVLVALAAIVLLAISISATAQAQQQTAVSSTAAASHPWWSDRSAGLVGGIGGSAVGLVGAFIGLASSHAILRRTVMGVLFAMICIGAISLTAGGVALGLSQPYRVYYPLLLLGFFCTALPLGLRKTVSERFVQHELRKISSMDAS